jgi:SAM-dependent methyltransferase
MSLDYAEIRRRVDKPHNIAAQASASNLIHLCKSEDPFLYNEYDKAMSKYMRRIVGDIEGRTDAKILVVGSASLDYPIHLQMLTKKEVYGIDVVADVIHAQSERIKAIRESDNYDDLEKKFSGLEASLGFPLEIRNFREEVNGTMHHYAPFRMVKESLSHIHPIQADAHTIPFDEKMFDFVFFDCTIEYSPYPEKFFEECVRVLKEGGLLFMISAWYNKGRVSEYKTSVFNQLLEIAERECDEVETEFEYLYARKKIN